MGNGDELIHRTTREIFVTNSQRQEEVRVARMFYLLWLLLPWLLLGVREVNVHSLHWSGTNPIYRKENNKHLVDESSGLGIRPAGDYLSGGGEAGHLRGRESKLLKTRPDKPDRHLQFIFRCLI